MKNSSEEQIFPLLIKTYFVRWSPLQDLMLSFYSNISAKTTVIIYLFNEKKQIKI